MTRGCRALALMVFVAGLLATPLGGRALARACAATAVHVAIVVDLDNSGGVRAICMPAGTRDNGATVLATRASMLGLPQPRYNASGLLCAIDGIPETGCGTARDGHYAYWAYFHGTNGKWTYNNFGPASWRVSSGVVEGWRWQPDGSGLPTDPPPRGSANAAATCVPAPPPTTVARTTVPTSPRSTSAAGPTTTVGTQETAITGTVGPKSVNSTPPTTRPVSAATVAAGSTPTSGGRSPTARAAGESSTSTVVPAARGVAAAGSAGSTHSSSGAPIGLIAGVLLVAGLGAAGAIVARRRSRSVA